jgi:thioredoxin
LLAENSLNYRIAGPIITFVPPMDITATDFEREVIAGSRDQLVLVDFWAPWCGPCRALTPLLEKLAAEYAGRVKLVKINSDENQEISTAFGIRSIPNVIAFRDGKAVSQFLGALPEGQVRSFIDKLLPPPQLAAAKLAIDESRLDEAERLLGEIQPDMDWDAQAETLRQALAFARAGGGSEKDLAAKGGGKPGRPRLATCAGRRALPRGATIAPRSSSCSRSFAATGTGKTAKRESRCLPSSASRTTRSSPPNTGKSCRPRCTRLRRRSRSCLRFVSVPFWRRGSRARRGTGHRACRPGK